MTFGSRTTSAGLPSTSTLPRSSTMARSTKRHHDFHDMFDHQHGDAGIAHLAHQLDAGLGLDWRQSREHLVQQQQFRLGRECAGDFESALFGRHQIAGEHVGARAKPAELQHLMRLAAGIAHHGGADQRADDDVVDHSHGLKTLHDLEGAADPALAAFGRRQRGDVITVEDDRALRGRQHARDQVEQRRLAGAVRADEADDFATPDRDRDVAVRNQAAEALPDAAGFEEWRRRHRTASLRLGENRLTSPCGRASEIAMIRPP